jgi:hypothetical protein
MGENFIRGHLWARVPHMQGYVLGQLRQLEKMRRQLEVDYKSMGMSVGTYRPSAFPDDALSPAELETMKQQLRDDGA